jgi:hypothetical protein
VRVTTSFAFAAVIVLLLTTPAHGQRVAREIVTPIETVSAAAFERRPTATDVRQLLLLLPGTVQGRPIDKVQVSLETGKTTGARPIHVPPGATWKASGSTLDVIVPDHLEVISSAFAFPRADRPFGRVDIRYFEGKRQVWEERLTPWPLNRAQRVTDTDAVIVLPPRLSPGDRIEFRPVDPNFTPGGGEWRIGGWRPTWNGSYDRPLYHFDVPADPGQQGPLQIRYESAWRETLVDGVATGVTVGSVPQPAGSEAALLACSPAVLDGGPLCLCGSFPPDATAALLINGRPVGEYLVSSSPTIAVLKFPSDFPAGPFLFSTGDRSGFSIADSARGVLIRVGGEIDRSKLLRGQSTTMRLWLTGTDERTDLKLWNSTPAIVSLEGGNDQVVTSSGGAPNEVSRTVFAGAPGDFSLNYQLTIDTCPCAKERDGR